MPNIQKALSSDRIKGGALSTAVFALLSLLISAVLLKKDITASLYFPLLLGTAAISGAFGGVSATKKSRKNGLLNGAAAAVLPIAAYLIAVAGLSKNFEIGSLLPCLALLIGSISAGIVAANRRSKPKIKKRK